MADSNYVLLGDYRDIPMGLGLVGIGWNRCDGELREIIKILVARNVIESHKAIEIIVTELGTVGVTQALRCLADEIPKQESELSEALIHALKVTEALKAKRNYYVHGIQGVTQYGLIIEDGDLEKDTPFSDFLSEGPFAQVYQKTAKGKSKWFFEFLEPEAIISLNNEIAVLGDFLTSLATSLRLYLRGLDWREKAPLPPMPPLPTALVKREMNHPKLRRPPSLTPNPRPDLEDDEEG